jgi:hypothetical protein
MSEHRDLSVAAFETFMNGLAAGLLLACVFVQMCGD